MNPALPSSLSDIGVSQYGYPTSDPESAQGSSGSGKKRASRAGTRSVSTLSAAQLDRKRANDREAQRAIRQRTKDHIENLEKTISELRGAQEASDKMLAVTQQRSREIQEENAFLRAKLSEAGVTYSVDPHQARAQPEYARSNSSATRGSLSSSVQSVDSAPIAQGPLSIVPPQLAGSQPAFWKQPPSNMMQVHSAPGSLHDPSVSTQMGQSHLTNWRSHDGSQNMQPHPSAVQDDQPPSAAGAMLPQYPPQWNPTQAHAYHHGHGHVMASKREPTPHQQDAQYAQSSPSSLYPTRAPPPPPPQQQQQAYQTASGLSSPTPPPPQTAYSTNPVVYRSQQQQQQSQQQQQQQQYQLTSPASVMSGTFASHPPPPPPQPSMQGEPQPGVGQTYAAQQAYTQQQQQQQQQVAYPGEAMGPPPGHGSGPYGNG